MLQTCGGEEMRNFALNTTDCVRARGDISSLAFDYKSFEKGGKGMSIVSRDKARE